MLAIAAALLLGQAKPQIRPPFESPFAKKFVLEAQKRGWRTANTNAGNAGGYILLSQQLTTQNRLIRVWVYEAESEEAAKKNIASVRSGSNPRTPLEEPILKYLGLQADVLDYSNKRLSDLKEYASTNMRITGTVGQTAIHMWVHPISLGNLEPKEKAPKDVYDDMIYFAKYLVGEMKPPLKVIDNL